MKTREVWAKAKHPVLGPYTVPLPPFRVSKNSFKIRPAPLLGEHNDYAYRELRGLSDEEFAELSNDGIFA